MAQIDPDGLFNGDRFDLVSDQARLAWPHLWCATNTMGRIELNYEKVVERVFRGFKKPPSREVFWGWIAEYQEAFLLFVYEHDGQVWGAWSCSEKHLPKYKLANDVRKPAPDGPTFEAWKTAYVDQKRKSIVSNVSGNLGKVFENVQKFSIGVGCVGVGCVGKNSMPEYPPARVNEIPKRSKSNDRSPDIQGWFDAEFWPAWPRKEDKGAARSAAEEKLKDPLAREFAMRLLRVQLPHLMRNGVGFCPKARKWIESQDFSEESGSRPVSTIDPVKSKDKYVPPAEAIANR